MRLIRMIRRMLFLAGLVAAGKWAYDQFVAPTRAAAGPTRFGYDTPTGTSRSAKYDRPGYEDKSFGQAVDQDMHTADRLLEETHGDMAAASERFRAESAGAPALERQEQGNSYDR